MGKRLIPQSETPNNYEVHRQFCDLFTVALYMYMCIKFAPVKEKPKLKIHKLVLKQSTVNKLNQKKDCQNSTFI